MTYRLAVLGFEHETNTFSGNLATLAVYERDGLFRGPELLERHLTSQATLAGFLATDETLDVELVPILSAWLNPCGPISAEAFEAITAEMAAGLAGMGPFDGVLLALHGAAVAVHVRGADAEIAARMRAVVGSDVPIAVVVDMHANVDPRLLEHIDVLRAYQTNPHVDARERGVEARAALVDILARGHRPTLALAQLPLVVTITRQDTSEEPMAPLLAAARALEERPGVLDVSILEGFPYADVVDTHEHIVGHRLAGLDPLVLLEQRPNCPRGPRHRSVLGGRSQGADAEARALLQQLDVGGPDVLDPDARQQEPLLPDPVPFAGHRDVEAGSVCPIPDEPVVGPHGADHHCNGGDRRPDEVDDGLGIVERGSNDVHDRRPRSRSRQRTPSCPLDPSGPVVSGTATR